MNRLLQYICVLWCLFCIYSQTISAAPKQDTARHVHRASVQYADTALTSHEQQQYEALKESASKRRWTQSLYSSIFTEPKAPSKTETNDAADVEYQPFAGKTINDIKIVVLDPFGTDIDQPDSTYSHWLNRAGNALHVKTKRSVIRKNLLFKQGEKLNPLVIAESEAFLRNTGYIHDARILVDSISGSSAVDITVIVRDVFPIGLDIHSLSRKSIDMEIYDRNFLGIGSEAFLRGMHNRNYHPSFGYGLGYQYNNLLNTFINLSGSYMDEITNRIFLLSAERPLQTSLHIYGQTSFQQTDILLNVAPWDSVSPPYVETFSASLGYAFDLDSKTGRRVAVAARFIDNKPSFSRVLSSPNPLQYEFVKKQMFLTQYSLFQQRYYRQYMIRNFGVTENIAFGYNMSAQLGYAKVPGYFEGLYTSFSVAAGNQFSFGNLYVLGAISSYFKNQKALQGMFKSNINYFTPLFYMGKSRLRQFVNLNYVRSINSVDGLVDYVYFNTLSSLKESANVRGTDRLMMNLETDWFTNINIVGFRLLIFYFFDGGWIASKHALFAPNQFFWGTGLGVRIRNDMLVFKTVELKIGVYPNFKQSFSDYFSLDTFEPHSSPNFVPTYPQEITFQ